MIISDNWLNELSFNIREHFTISRQAGQLIIRLAEGAPNLFFRIFLVKQ
ncbi:MAG TPA: hypothetical protein ACHBX0_14515 [Arsenophonus sp.]